MNPLALLAELTHKCPLQCLYCSNPLELVKQKQELTTSNWQKVFRQAAQLGVLQVHLSGGEPLLRADIVSLVETLHDLDLYSNLVSSGIGLTRSKLDSLINNGLNSIQLSIQSSERISSKKIAAVDVFQSKIKALQLVCDSSLYLTINVVINSFNIEHLDEIIALCVEFRPNKIELANCQYHGWALKNRSSLLPNELQIERAHEVYLKWNKELREKTELVWVYSDYYTKTPKPCMGGWARKQMTITPDGVALPCPDAGIIDSLTFENVKDKSLEWIWFESDGFNAFRGYDWMVEPCKNCDKRFQDYGGCRCQTFALTGEATNCDPACGLSPDHSLIEVAQQASPARELYYRHD